MLNISSKAARKKGCPFGLCRTGRTAPALSNMLKTSSRPSATNSSLKGHSVIFPSANFATKVCRSRRHRRRSSRRAPMCSGSARVGVSAAQRRRFGGHRPGEQSPNPSVKSCRRPRIRLDIGGPQPHCPSPAQPWALVTRRPRLLYRRTASPPGTWHRSGARNSTGTPVGRDSPCACSLWPC